MNEPASDRNWIPNVPLNVLLSRAAHAKPETRMHFHTERGLTSVTTLELTTAADRLARGLRAVGLRRGDVIAMQLPTQQETAVLYIAALEVGAVLVPIVHIYGPAEVGFILRQSRARFLCVPERWRGIDFLERVEALGNLPDLERVIVVGERTPENGITLKEIEAISKHANLKSDSPPQPQDVCLLLYTSGTTAAPKGVQHTHQTVGAEWSIPFIDGSGPYLTPFPAGHIAGFNFLLRPFVTGTDMVFMDRWDAPLAAELIERYRVRLSGGTPFHLQGLLDAARHAGRDLSSLVTYGLGGTGVTPEHVALADSAGFAGTRAYGLTEHSTVSIGWRENTFAERACTDGRVQPGSQVRIVDEFDRDLPTGSEGEILTKGPELFVGYTDPSLNANAFSADGWFRTGDIGKLDAANCLTITDRKKDIVIRGGENISSPEVERVLATHNAIRDVAVVAQHDAQYGEKVCAVVVLQPGAELDLSAIQRHFAQAGVARQKTPEHLLIVDELPRTASGKVRKSDLRARANALKTSP
ncbi:AMP-binding protein [Paraburkholderia rhynchosiae]|uniref:Cyclohexanecarboxylate-CoA ligase n=1 Tax=Paraburkholderia rhynchosiae TaxID=487049 RepID=A0A2N7VXA6_9BURK|nr:AMP-binding protein [Paraburkholderia rhynchosiae]PMS21773.1 cyclohexanecarboxylate-CoA ligase [Paraburkholderia rhynchosiae]CAB3739149.1 Medium-chain fatty-acid--CoA ligase [Paraburkholderia rhynchosiae]